MLSLVSTYLCKQPGPLQLLLCRGLFKHGIQPLVWGTYNPADDDVQRTNVHADTAEEQASQGPYLYQPSESRSARVINRAGSPARSESSAFSRQAQLEIAIYLRVPKKRSGL